MKAWYWCIVTVTGTGYGDVTPSTVSGKAFTIAYVYIACFFLGRFVFTIVSFPMLRKTKKVETELLKQFGSDFNCSYLKDLLDNELFHIVPNLKSGTEKLSKTEFILVLLHAMKKIKGRDVFYITEVFQSLDLNARGKLLFSQKYTNMNAHDMIYLFRLCNSS